MTRTSRAIHTGLRVAYLVGALGLAGAIWGWDKADELRRKIGRRKK